MGKKKKVKKSTSKKKAAGGAQFTTKIYRDVPNDEVFDLIAGLQAEQTIADKAYDANKFIYLAQEQGSEVVIPPKSNRLVQREFDHHIYKERHLVECFFAKIKVFRRISTRYDKLAVTFRAAVLIASCMVWLR